MQRNFFSPSVVIEIMHELNVQDNKYEHDDETRHMRD